MQLSMRSGLFWLLLLGAGYQVRAEILYSVTDLGTLGGSRTDTTASAINNAGQVTGVSDNHAFLYSNGQMQDQGTVGGGTYSKGTSINDAGQVTGFSLLPQSVGQHAFFYSNGQIQDLGTFGGINSKGNGINNAGQVTGVSQTSSGSGDMFLYSNGQTTDLGPGNGPGINDRGQIVGQAIASCTDLLHCTDYFFIYSNGQRQVLGNMPENAIITGINNAGQLSGSYYPPGSASHAFLYTNGQLEDLGSLGRPEVEGEAINDAGEVVGAAGTDAFVYVNGQMLDLNNLIDPALLSTGDILNEATGINDRGQIVVNANNLHAYLLTPLATPVPEPCTLALCGLALLGLGLRVRMRQN